MRGRRRSKGAPSRTDASPSRPGKADRPAKVKQPLYPRLLRLRHISPNGWQRAALGEGAIAAGVLLSLADLASAWSILVLPVAVAMVVKAHDYLQGLLEQGRVEPRRPDRRRRAERRRERRAAKAAGRTRPAGGRATPAAPGTRTPSEATPSEATPSEATPSEATPSEATAPEATLEPAAPETSTAPEPRWGRRRRRRTKS